MRYGRRRISLKSSLQQYATTSCFLRCPRKLLPVCARFCSVCCPFPKRWRVRRPFQIWLESQRGELPRDVLTFVKRTQTEWNGHERDCVPVYRCFACSKCLGTKKRSLVAPLLRMTPRAQSFATPHDALGAFPSVSSRRGSSFGPDAQNYRSTFTLNVLTAADPAALSNQLRSAIASLDAGTSCVRCADHARSRDERSSAAWDTNRCSVRGCVRTSCPNIGVRWRVWTHFVLCRAANSRDWDSRRARRAHAARDWIVSFDRVSLSRWSASPSALVSRCS